MLTAKDEMTLLWQFIQCCQERVILFFLPCYETCEGELSRHCTV